MMKEKLREWGVRFWGVFKSRDAQVEEELRSTSKWPNKTLCAEASLRARRACERAGLPRRRKVLGTKARSAACVTSSAMRATARAYW